jgi:hypothetical protein
MLAPACAQIIPILKITATITRLTGAQALRPYCCIFYWKRYNLVVVGIFLEIGINNQKHGIKNAVFLTQMLP